MPKLNTKIRKIEFLYINQPSRRKIKITLVNGTKIYIKGSGGGYKQIGATTDDERWLGIGIGEQYSAWLNGCIDEDYCGI